MKILAFGAFYLVIAIVSSCVSNDRKVKIGFSIRGFVIDRCVKERDFFVEKMNQLGGQVIVTDAQENDKLQIQQCSELMQQDIDALVIFPVNLNTSAAIVREANQRHVKVVAYESLIQNCDLDYFVSADNEKGGMMIAQHTVKLIPQGNYILIGGDKADRNAILIKNGQYQILNPLIKQGNIKIIYDIYADWTADEAYHQVRKAINLSGIIPDAILSSNDGMATGVIKLLEEVGLAGQIPVTGLDGELSAFKRVAKGTQSMTVFKSFKIEAYAAAEIAFQLASGKKPDKLTTNVFNGNVEVPSYLIEPVLVDKDNIHTVVANSGMFTEKEVFE